MAVCGDAAFRHVAKEGRELGAMARVETSVAPNWPFNFIFKYFKYYGV